MRFVIVLLLSHFTLATAQDFFSIDPPLDDSLLLWDDLDATGDLDATDPFPLPYPSEDSEEELSSCFSENPDSLFWSKVRVRARARNENSLCSPSDQPIPFKNVLPNDGGKDQIKELEDLFALPSEEDEDSVLAPQLIDDVKCLPGFRYNLCCRLRESLYVEIYMGVEISYYHTCMKS